jgi:hypothetical protein
MDEHDAVDEWDVVEVRDDVVSWYLYLCLP